MLKNRAAPFLSLVAAALLVLSSCSAKPPEDGGRAARKRPRSPRDGRRSPGDGAAALRRARTSSRPTSRR